MRRVARLMWDLNWVDVWEEGEVRLCRNKLHVRQFTSISSINVNIYVLYMLNRFCLILKF